MPETPPDPPRPVRPTVESRTVPVDTAWVDRYRVLGPLGRGGMGEVLLAEDTVLRRKVALKRVPTDHGKKGPHRRRLLQEAQRASRFSDHRIAQVFDVVEEKDQLVLVMEYVEGTSLRQRMSSPLGLESFWDLGVQCVETLEAAHRGGLLHRDIKPENIMITPSDQVKILDFGIAKRLPRREELTSMSTELDDLRFAGTPAYMSPEALMGQDLDARTDIFSLGVVFYELLAGMHPFAGENRTETLDRILHQTPLPPSARRGELPASLDVVIGRMLSKQPSDRYETATAVLDDLMAARRGEHLASLPAPRPQPEKRLFLGRRPRWAWLLGAVLVAGVVALATNGDVRLQIKRALGLGVLPPVRNVAVIPFVAAGGDSAFLALGAGLTELVTERLHHRIRETSIRVLPGALIQWKNVQTASNARRELGANLALKTELVQRDQGVAGALELVDAHSGRVLDRAEIQPQADLFALAGSLLREAEHTLGVSPAAGSIEDGWGTEAASAFRFYLEGKGRLSRATDDAALARASRDLETALSRDDHFVEAWIGLARADHQQYLRTHDETKLVAARESAERARALDERNAQAHGVLGSILQETGDLAGAEQELGQAILLEPRGLELYPELASVYRRMGRKSDEEKAYRSAVRALANQYLCWWRLGNFLHEEGRSIEALEAYRSITEVAPDFYFGHESLGAFLIQGGQYTEGIRSCERSLDLKPTDYGFMNLGTAYFNLREFDRSIRTYDRAIELGQDTYNTWINLGDACWWTPGKRERALEAYKRGIDLAGKTLIAEPGREHRIRAIVADVFPKVGQPDSARVYIDRALVLAPGNPEVEQWAALVYWQLGQKAEALSWLEKAVADGYSRAWLRDSAVFDDWRGEPRFWNLVGSPTPDAPSTFPHASPVGGT